MNGPKSAGSPTPSALEGEDTWRPGMVCRYCGINRNYLDKVEPAIGFERHPGEYARYTAPQIMLVLILRWLDHRGRRLPEVVDYIPELLPYLARSRWEERERQPLCLQQGTVEVVPLLATDRADELAEKIAHADRETTRIIPTWLATRLMQKMSGKACPEWPWVQEAREKLGK